MLFPPTETPPSLAQVTEAAGPLFDMPAQIMAAGAEAGAGADLDPAPHNDERNPKQKMGHRLP
jgi:hypothetical protein